MPDRIAPAAAKAAAARFATMSIEDAWKGAVSVQTVSNGSQPLGLSNLAGRNYPSLFDSYTAFLLGIRPQDRVLDIGGGDSPFECADVVTDAFPNDNEHRSGRNFVAGAQREFVECFAESLPFPDRSFDFAYSRSVFEHTVDPAAACREMMRVAKRGFIEIPLPVSEYLSGHPTHRWLVWIERVQGKEPVLVFRRKQFLRAPFGHILRSNWFQDDDFRFRWEMLYRNHLFGQLQWEDHFEFRVEDQYAGIDYDDPIQAAELHLDTAINSLRFGGCGPSIVLADIEQALRLRPDWAPAHNTLGCALWEQQDFTEAHAGFVEAQRLDPDCEAYRRNAALNGGQSSAPELTALPPLTNDEGFTTAPDGVSRVHASTTPDGVSRNHASTTSSGVSRNHASTTSSGGIPSIQPEERVLCAEIGGRLPRADVFFELDAAHCDGRMPFDDSSFDFACSRMTLQRVMNPEIVCSELQRVARRGFLELPQYWRECFAGAPETRWFVEWEAPTRTLVFRRKTEASMPFKGAMVSAMLKCPDARHAFEKTHRYLTTHQIVWDEAHPFSVRVEDAPGHCYDYLRSPADAGRAHLSWARDLIEGGAEDLAAQHLCAAERLAPTSALRHDASRLRAAIAPRLAALEQNRGRLLGAAPNGSHVLLRSNPAPNATPRQSDEFYRALEVALSPVYNLEPLSKPVTVYRDEAISNAADEPDATRVARVDDPTRSVLNAADDPDAIRAARVDDPTRSVLNAADDPDAIRVARFDDTTRGPLAEVQIAALCDMNAIWVPDDSTLAWLASHAIDTQKIWVLPNPLDLAVYDPAGAALNIPGARGFNFLAWFDSGDKTGWKALLRAYVEEFQPEEDVALILAPQPGPGESPEDLICQLEPYLVNTLKVDPAAIPDILVQASPIPLSNRPNLYRTAQCFVMPSESDDFADDCREAMVMGLPVIASDRGAYREFMNQGNSLTVQPDAARKPDVNALRALLRQVFDDRQFAYGLGAVARAELTAQVGFEAVVARIREELRRLTE